jgi:2-(1,2-epoxy-1,2-dihydrophenyl)acetyl-CoA isomerase
MIMGEYTTLERRDQMALLTLNRPESYNAFDLPTAREVSQAVLQVSTDPAIHGLVLTGAGKAFSAGGDIKHALAHPDGPAAAFHELATVVHVAVVEIRRMSKPVIAAINGVAAGGGFSVALACDFRVMAESARLKQGFTSNALCIDGGGTFTLPRLVGLARALEIAALDEPIDARQALAWGLVTKVVQDGAVIDEALTLARTITRKSLHTFGWSKQLLNDNFWTPLEAQLERERQGLVSCVSHPDGVEGLHAFLEKRQAEYNRPPRG